ncbi:guanitoxin biosynthesis MBL fold metallo-hydrolase GntH [Ruegeria atlantica]|uniref:Ribonuclease BN n=1 Tax=Ruegeria atlantica TaxID=81569 RepID=A0A0P1E6P6_9RHOB|nr:guanitoxin biosynthesis MBL fold metallo-hydrolase GntH [Ruegeria atlantica]CUH44470.1 Ribonuclease BN [Ruegeria atlantica]CUH47804.1 Ribonuclease BN [Ruegeria atlantica]
MKRRTLLRLSTVFVAGLAFGAWVIAPDETTRVTGEVVEQILFPSAAYADEAAPTFSPVKALAERDVYYPGTEDIAEDEMRVTACGTGMPNARPAQAAACFLVELGNGDKFIFDIGTGSAERLSGLAIPYDYLDKVFIGHLHADHIGDLDALWVGGVIGNRQRPLRVWGPSGAEPELGTAHAVEGMKQMMTWDSASRLGNVNTLGLEIEMNEFDYKLENEIIYDENDVVIRTMPAVHALDGSVSYTLAWNDLLFAFTSDTYPNKWYIEYTKGADISIHESFLPPELLVKKQKWPVEDALNVGTQVHTEPSMMGKVMSMTEPRMAVAYHFFNDFDTSTIVEQQIRKTYDGPLSMATDYMVWNITKDDIRVRMAVINEDVWPLPSVTEKLPADPAEMVGFTDFLLEGREVFSDLIEEIYAETNDMFGTNVPLPN